MTRSNNIHGTDAGFNELLEGIAASEAVALREAWDLAGDAQPVSAVTRVSTWSRIEAATAAPAPVAARPALRLVSLPLFRRMAVAASIALVAVAGYLALPQDQVFEVAAGSAADVILLSDGTSVTLAAGSELRVDEDFGIDTREVALQGEAFFEVTPAADNSGLPFEIQTFNASVEVLGTAFNVRARRDELAAETRVAVEHGSVRVASDQFGSLPVVLAPGEGTRVESTSAPAAPAPVELEKALAWMNGGLAFDDVPMGVVFEELERRFDLEIDAPEAIRRLDVSYWRQSATEVNEILADLADVVDAEIRQTANGYAVYQLER